MYNEASLGLNEGQVASLMNGDDVFLSKTQFQGNTKVLLTGTQLKRIATASRGIKLRFSPAQARANQLGAGLLKDLAKAALPFARKGVDFGLDKLQEIVPTHKLGRFKGLGDAALKLGRKAADFGLDKAQTQLGSGIFDIIKSLFGGSVGIAKIDEQMGSGWFDQYLLPGIKTAAEIAVPLIRGRGAGAKGRPDYRSAIDAQMGSGWFDEYLLPGIKTAAQIATPFIRGRGFPAKDMNGEGWFDSLLDVIKVVAPIGIKMATGRGWVPMDQKKSSFGMGMVL